MKSFFSFFKSFPGVILLLLALSLGGWWGNKAYHRLEKKGCFNLAQPSVALPDFSGKQSLHLVALGDAGTGQAGQKEVAQSLVRFCQAQPCDLVLYLGDNFYPKGVKSAQDPKFQTHFEEIYAGLNLPFLVVAGNHDAKGSLLAQVEYSQAGGRWIMPNFRYHLSAGPAALAAGNSNCGPLHWREAAQFLAQAPEPWKIFFAHHPVRSLGPHGDLSWPWPGVFDQLFGPWLDFALAGHDHNLQVLSFGPGQPWHIISGGGGAEASHGPDQSLSGPGPQEAKILVQDRGFVYFSLTQSEAEVMLVDHQGNVLHRMKKHQPSSR